MAKLNRIHWNEKAGAAPNASRELPALVTAYFAQGREMLSNSPKASELHALRLLTKRFRYTLELFRTCYGPGLRLRLATLRRIQQCLGEINDCVTVVALLAESSPKSSPQRKRIDQFLEQRSQSLIAEFRREWTEVFDAPGKERWWTSYLTRHARLPARK
jgi:CHAD domain-containing protein